MTDDLTSLQKLVEAATPGPWRYRKGFPADKFEPKGYAYVQFGPTERAANGRGTDQLAPKDAALIVAAVNALPDLIDRLKRAEAALSERRPVWLVIRADSADVMGAHDDELSALQDLTARNQHVSALDPGYHIEKWLVQRSGTALEGDSE